MKLYENPTLTIFEVASILVWLPVITFILFYYSHKKYKDPAIRRDFVLSALLKIMGGQLICLLYIFVYQWGDTLRYFKLGLTYRDLFIDSQFSFFEVLFMSGDEFANLIQYKMSFAYVFESSIMSVIRLSGFLSVFTFGSFLVTTMFFSLISFTGVWKLYQALIEMYPRLRREMAFAALYIPSVIIWGSGLLKDSLCISAIGWAFWAIHSFLVPGIKSKGNVFFKTVAFIVAIYVIITIKTYIAVAFLGGIGLWAFVYVRDKIENKVLKTLSFPILLSIAIPVVLFAMNLFSEELEEYALDKVLETAVDLNYNIMKLQDAGSYYDLGPLSPDLGSMLRKIPAAINVTLFRPYPWEASSFVVIFAAVESLILLLLTLYIVFKVGIFKFTSTAFSRGIIFFCFSYSLVFAFAVGITSTTFGTLVRYKIPCIPFFVMGLFIVYYHATGEPLFNKSSKAQKRKKAVRPPQLKPAT